MANFHVYECDRCLKREDNAASLPRYWATVKILDTNRSAQNDGREYEKTYCPRCMDVIRSAMAVIPKNIAVVDKQAI